MNATQVKSQIAKNTSVDFKIENLGDSRHFLLKSNATGFEKMKPYLAIKKAGFETLSRYHSSAYSLIVDFKIY